MDSYSVITHNKYLPFFQRKRISDRPRLRLRFSGCIGFIKLNNIQLFYSKQIKTKEFTSLVTKKTERAGIRTPDNLIKSQVLYHLSYTPLFNFMFLDKQNAQSRNRTSDTRIFSPLLYQLSYLGIRLKSLELRGQDLNLRPSGYEPDELPDCSTPRYYIFMSLV